jgi:hypothetical protein
MTDQISFPPLHDPSPGELERRKQHLLSEIARDAHPRRRPSFALAPRRLAVVGAGAALAVAGVAALVITTQAPQSPSTVSSSSHSAMPPGFQPLALTFASGAQGVSSINVTVNSPISDASLQIQVFRSDASPPDQGETQSPADPQVVFQEQIPMTNISSPATGPGGTVALATWSGVLTTSDWTGGCQNALYQVVAEIAAPSGSYSSFSAPADTFKWRWFTCSSG